MEELLAPVLQALNQHHGLAARLDLFIKLFGGGEVHRDGDMSRFRWYGTEGFACLFGGWASETSKEPPKLLNIRPTDGENPSAIFQASTLPVASTFNYNGQEYVVVCNETRGQSRQRMLFLAVLRRAVEKMSREMAEMAGK